jgi:hypothetical protein
MADDSPPRATDIRLHLLVLRCQTERGPNSSIRRRERLLVTVSVFRL